MPRRAPPLPTGIQSSRPAEIANRLHTHAILLLRRARLEDRRTGLTPERLSLLSVLTFGGPRTVSELAAAEMVSAPAISRILGALQADGLIRRVRSRRDRRLVQVHATDLGKSLMERGRLARVNRIAEELVDLNEAQLTILEQALSILELPNRASEVSDPEPLERPA